MNGDMEPTKEAFATVHDHIKNAQGMLQEPDDDDDAQKHSPKVLERFLREAGLTRSEARGLLAKVIRRSPNSARLERIGRSYPTCSTQFK